MRRSSQVSSYYPIFLSIRGKKCLVVGGGKVALRKVKALLQHGGNVEVVSPITCPELNQLAEAKEINVRNKNYQPRDLDGAFITIAATDERETNKEIAGEAKRRGILVNVVDSPDESDFIVPSYFRRGDLTIAVSTSGGSPALAQKIRTELEQDFGNEYASLTALIREVRSEVRKKGYKVSGDAWQKALDLDALLKLLHTGKKKEARAILLDNLERPKQTDS